MERTLWYTREVIDDNNDKDNDDDDEDNDNDAAVYDDVRKVGRLRQMRQRIMVKLKAAQIYYIYFANFCFIAASSILHGPQVVSQKATMVGPSL